MVRTNRREFMGLAAGGTLATLAAATIGEVGSQAAANAATQTDYPAIVIGSGFGGAVTALRLGQAKVQTLVIERGQDWTGTAATGHATYSDTKAIFDNQGHVTNKCFYMRATADWPSVPPLPMLPAPGVMEVSDENGIAIGAGAGVGGGSLVYTGATIAPPQQYFERLNYGVSWAEMGQWYQKAHDNLQPSVMPADVLAADAFTHSRVWNKHIAGAGYTPGPLEVMWNWDKIRQEIKGTSQASALHGDTDFGVSNGSKKSLDQTYLPAALATGYVRIQALTAVLTIGRAANGKWQVTTHTNNTAGVVVSSQTYTSDLLFLCAGSMNTTRLLVAARDSGALPNLSATVGSGWGDNGDQYSLYAYTGGAGPSQGSPSAAQIFVDDPALGLPIRAESWQLRSAGTLPVIMTLVMTADTDHRGTWTYNKLTKKVSLSNWTANAAPAAKTASNWVNKIIAKNSGLVPFGLTWPLTLTAHPLGGVNMNVSSDSYGRVKGYPGLYAIDGSMLPGNVGGANPSYTITALAERAIANIIATGQ